MRALSAVAFVDGDPVRFIPGPIWARLYYPILASLVMSVAIYLVDLVRPWMMNGMPSECSSAGRGSSISGLEMISASTRALRTVRR